MPSPPQGSFDPFDEVQPVADAIMYEGYVLYPYRKSSAKNRVRFQFGVLFPPHWAKARGLVDTGVAGSEESWWQQTEIPVEIPSDATGDATIRLRCRFLHLRGSTDDASLDEATPHEHDAEFTVADLLGHERRTSWPIRRDKNDLTAAITASMTPCAEASLYILRVRVANVDTTLPASADRDEALRRSLIACHCLLAVDHGGFVSLLDPPPDDEPVTKSCRNVHTFPVLAGAPGRRDLVLSSPILLYDHPRIAPESPGDLYDATEIDEILSLRTLTLTDEEKQEARRTDPRAAAIIDRLEAMSPRTLERLHGTLRERHSALRDEQSTLREQNS
ncbi:MAG TPA: hypothetical protein VI076_00405 [Actinopolymorphaceae bacterium]